MRGMRLCLIFWGGSAHEAPSVYIEGYINIFSISVYTRLNMTMTHMELLVRGNFLNLIKAEVFVAAEYSFTLSFNDAKFYIKVEVDLSGLNALPDAAAKAVKGAFEAAQKELGNARRTVIEKKAECKRKMSLKCDKCKDLKCKQAETNCKGALDKFGKWIGGVVNAAGQWVVKTVKKIGKAFQAVGNFVKKIFKGWRRKRELQNRQNELFALHIRRRRFISKLICEGIVGGGCKAVSFLCEGTCRAIEFIGKGLCNILDVAIGFLKGIEAVCGWVSKAIQFVLTKLFRIHSIKFEFSMESYRIGIFKSMVFNAAVDLTIFGKRLYLALAFSLTNPFESLKGGANKATHWYKDKMNPKGRTDTEKQYYDKPNPFADFEMSEQFAIENQQSATDDRKGGCLYAESKTKNTYIKVTGCNNTDERQLWAYTLKGQLMNIWSRFCIDTNGGSAGNKLIQSTCNPSRDDQNFQCDLIVRTVKRRRVNMCWQAGMSVTRIHLNLGPSMYGKVGLNGPGSLVHLGSLKCIHVAGGGYGTPGDGAKLVIHSGCSEKRLEFALENGHLIHKGSGKCVAPIGKVVDGVRLGLYSNCAGVKFSFTKGGSLQHIGSRKCINTRSLSTKPANSEDIILHNKCENNDLSLEKQRLIFNFIPTDPYITLRPCTDFGNPRLDQRFEVEDEPIATVCSKFSKNIAFKKKTTQSSTEYNGYSERAVDENFNPYFNQKSCTHTKNENNPWWRVDLGSEHIITDVLIVNRYDKFERLKNFEVKVGVHSNQALNPTCNDRIVVVGQGQALRVQCNPPIPGRYVAVQMYGRGILTMCEVAVYSRLAPLADLCQLENGNCEQTCYNLCNMKTKCGCYPGYKLAYDGKTCIDNDECQVNNGGCDVFKSICLNTPGSYMCFCRKGFQTKENNRFLCEDHNECKTSNAGCEHVCENTKGSFKCNCLKGYKLTENKYGCEEIYCPVLEAPFRGSIQPQQCTDDRANIRRNSMCTYLCDTGHKLAKGDRSLTCNLDGTWSGRVPYCTPVLCPKLPVLGNGGVIPSSCSIKDVEYGMRCVFHCSPGYELRGPRYTTCNNTKWTETAPVSCMRVYKQPWIQCPADVVVQLTPASNTAVLGYKWRLPTTNMKTAVVYPSGLNENYAFRAGKTRVTWRATNQDGVSKSCFFYVIVEDKTPPMTSNCPQQPIVIKSDNALVTVSWTEPTFTDNVGVVMTMASKRPGHQMERDTSLNVRYTAVDAAGNTAHCNFQVSAQRYSPPVDGKCKMGSILLESKCMNCAPGTFHDRNDNKCVECGTGAFQDVDGMTACQPCDNGFTTKGTRSTKASDCLPQCRPGTYSDNGLQESFSPCEKCPVGTYQAIEGQSSCTPCPHGSTTNQTGSASIDSCTVPASIAETFPAKELKVDVGNVMILECFVSGRPSPTVTWTKVGAPQPSPERVDSSLFYDLSMTVVGRDYVISSAQTSDSGIYECRVQNALASASHQVRVIVQTPPPSITTK
ncbi:hypothetical protein QZH41_017862 [Actinostola sp. cb2023]|nr:hypothetical protein QZH41_017862 [Actinostola sp. cb2023]